MKNKKYYMRYNSFDGEPPLSDEKKIDICRSIQMGKDPLKEILWMTHE